MVSWCAYPLLSHCLAWADELQRICQCKWSSEDDDVILEVSEPEKKSTYDADSCSWKQLLSELEEEGHTEVTINHHELTKPCAGEGCLVQGCPSHQKASKFFLFLAITDAHIDLGLPDAFLRDPDRIWFRAHLLSLRWLTLRTWLLPDQTQANGDALLLDQSQHQPAEVHGHWQRVSREGVGTYPLGFATFHPDLLGLGLTYHYSHSVSLQTGGSTATKQVGKCWQDWYHDVGRCLSGPTIDHVLNWYRIPLWNKNRNTGGLDSNFLKVFGWATQRSSQFGKATVWVCWVLGGAQRPNAARQNATRNACQSVLPYRSTNNLPQYRCRWRNMDRSTNNLPQYTCRWRNIFIYIYIYNHGSRNIYAGAVLTICLSKDAGNAVSVYIYIRAGSRNIYAGAVLTICRSIDAGDAIYIYTYIRIYYL